MLWIDSHAMSTRGWAPPTRRLGHPISCRCHSCGMAMLIATPASSQTSRNLQSTGKVRVGLGPTRDVVVIEGTTQTLDAHDVPSDMRGGFAVDLEPFGCRSSITESDGRAVSGSVRWTELALYS